MDRYAKGYRPEGYGKPKCWYVHHPNNGEFYPAKMIWAITCNKVLHTTTARRNLEKLGFFVCNIPQISEPSDFQRAVNQSLGDTETNRRQRLANARNKPEYIYRISYFYQRNPDVIAERLKLANGICADCGNPAPFFRATDKTPFLEVHHDIPLSKNGDDTLENTRALCPNCHRKAHHG